MHTLTLTMEPQFSATLNKKEPVQVAVGTKVRVVAQANTGYRFLNWKRGDEVVSESYYFDYIMPDEDVTLTAYLTFDPEGPGDPDIDVPTPTYQVLTHSSPQFGGTTSYSTPELKKIGETVYFNANAAKNYRFLYWKENGIEVSQQSYFYITMPERDVEMTAYFQYDPTSPGNPNSNSWNEATGVLIMDDFVPGRLYETIKKIVDNVSEVQQLIVTGIMTENDFYLYVDNCTVIDLTRVSDLKKVPRYAFQNMKKLNAVLLPPSVEEIDQDAFSGCTSLSNITLNAITPPKADKNAFHDVNTKDILLYVPASSVQLYEQADVWKDFIIKPITENLTTLNIILPIEAKDGRYKNATIQVFNVQNGQYQRNLVTDRMRYSFPLLSNCTYNVTLLGAGGVELGRWMGIDLKDNFVDVLLKGAKMPQTFELSVMKPNGAIANQCDISWTGTNGQFLGTGTKLEGVVPGQELTARFALRQPLATQYQTPAVQTYTVAESGNQHVLTLIPFETMSITGTIKDAQLGNRVSKATIAMSQTLNGQTKTVTTMTDDKGDYTMEVVKAEGELTVSCNGYMNATIPFDGQTAQYDVKLKAITGATITLDVSYITNGLNPSDRKMTLYENIDDLTFSVKGHSYAEQYPLLVVTDDAKVGDQLTLTVSSRTGSFLPVTTQVTLDTDLHAKATFAIKELGDAFIIIPTPKQNVTGMVYDEQGCLVRTATFPFDARLKVSHLTDGRYTVVAMTTSEFFGTIDRLDRYAELGLTEGTDYVKGNFAIQSSEEKYIELPAVPSFDESRFYYTGKLTKFSTNKSSYAAFRYVTVKTVLDLKKDILERAKNTRITLTLPEGIHFIDGSVVRNGKSWTWEQDGQLLTIPIEADGVPVNFCVLPTVSGKHTLTAYVQMELDGKTVMQPIGSANFNVTELSIYVTPLTSNGMITIEGLAQSDNRVDVYEDGQFVGTTYALADGTWHLNHQLTDPQNLFTYDIQAIVTTSEGIEIKSPTKQVFYCYNDYRVENVYMSYRTIEMDFDWNNQTVTPTCYRFVPASEGVKLTFSARLAAVDIDNVNGVTIHVYTSNDKFVDVPTTFDPKTGLWVGRETFDSNNMPVCASATVSTKEPVKAILEERTLTEAYQFFSDWVGRMAKPKAQADELIAKLNTLGVEAYNTEEYKAIERQLMALVGKDNYERPDVGDYTPTDEEITALEANLQALLDDPVTKNLTDEANLQYATISDIGNLVPGMTFGTADDLTAEALLADGFEEQLTTEGKFYVKYTAEVLEFVDLKANVRMTVDVAKKVQSVPRRASDGGGCGGSSDDANSAIEDLKYWGNQVNSMVQAVNGYISKIDGECAKRLADLDNFIDDANRILSSGKASVLTQAELIYKRGIAIGESVVLYGVKEDLKYLTTGKLGKALAGLSLAANIYNAINDISDLASIYCSIPDCPDCGGADDIKTEAGALIAATAGFYTAKIAADIVSLTEVTTGLGATVASAGAASPGALAAIGAALVETAIMMGCDYMYSFVTDNAKEKMNNEIAALKERDECKCDDDDECAQDPDNIAFGDNGCGRHDDDDDDDDDDNHHKKKKNNRKKSPKVSPLIDPSGYVYEAVSSNRVEGVTATIFYKEEREDMYGNIYEEEVMWDAENYAQQNPLFTDAEGKYQWDVPQGMWQVRFQKEGYEPTQSEWLPVPPPQLEVNIPITQLRAPQVAEVHAYSDGTVELSFDKYMEPATLNSNTIYLKKKTGDDEQLVALDAMTFPDEEIAYEGQEERYARTVRLTTQEDLSLTKEVTLIVDRGVKSYAGVSMQDTYQQTLDVEQRISQLVADSLLMVENGTEKTVTVKAIPAAAVQGKTLTVNSRSESIATADVASAAFNEQGEATVTLRGQQLGQTEIVYGVSDGNGKAYGNVEAATLVDVFMRTNDKISYSLKKGWNWMSHWLCTPITPQTTAIEQILSEQGEVTAIGSMAGYKVKTTEKTRLSAEGPQLENGEKTTLLVPGWNWVAYPYQQAARLNTAVMQAEEGDVMAGQSGFAIYEGGLWTGTLTALQPGRGYMYRSKSTKPLTYAVTAGQKVTADRIAETERWTPDNSAYANTMNMVAQLYDGSAVTTDYTVGVFDANGECRGVSLPIGKLLYITIYGNEGDMLNFVASKDDTAPMYVVKETMPFTADLTGSRTSPVILHLTNETAIKNAQLSTSSEQQTFNVAGQRLKQRRQGVNIIVNADGTTRKVVVK